MKYKLRGVVYLLLAIIILGTQVITSLGLLLEWADSSASYYGLVIGDTLIWVANIVIAIVLVVKAVRLFRLREGEVLNVSKKENIFLLILIVFAWVAAPTYLHVGKPVSNLNNLSSETKQSINDQIKSISPVVASLPPAAIDDLAEAYRVLHMLYENPRPTDLDHYFIYTECAKHIVNEVAFAKLTPPELVALDKMTVAPQFTTFKENNFAPQPPLFLALQSLVAADVGDNNVQAYISSGMVDENKFYSPSKEACQGLNIPEVYKM